MRSLSNRAKRSLSWFWIVVFLALFWVQVFVMIWAAK